MRRQLVINADDFGQTDAISDGVVQAARRGVVTSASLLCTGGAAAERAVALAGDIPGLGVGAHLNLTAAKPIGPPEPLFLLVGPDGSFNHSPTWLFLRSLGCRRLRSQVRREWAAQIEWFIARAGRPPTHLDSHKHLHAAPALFRIACELAADYRIGFVRLVAEPLWRGAWVGPHRPLTPARQCRQLVNAQLLRCLFARLDRRTLRRFGLRSADRFYGVTHTGGWSAATMDALLDRLPEGVNELMVHPGLADDAATDRVAPARPMELAALLSPGLRDRIAAKGIELVNYGQLTPSSSR